MVIAKDTSDSDLIKINEEVVKTFTGGVSNNNYSNAISWCLWELVDNAKVHSNSTDCVLFAKKYPNSDMTEFCIADRGIGIKETMGSKNIIEALTLALTKEGKGIHSKGKGNGLHFTSELIKSDTSSKSKSMLSILSENGVVEISSGTQPKIQESNTYWKGTIVTLSLSPNIKTNIEDILGTTVYGAEDLPNLYL